MRLRRLPLALAASALIGTLLPWSGAEAKFVDGPIVITNDQQTHRREYPAFTGSNPYNGLLWPSYNECQSDTVDHCHLHTIEFRPKKANGHETRVSVGWPQNEGVLVIVLYDEFGNNIGQGTSSDNPDTVGPIPDLVPGTYHLAVMNRGVQSPYWVEGSAEFVEIVLPQGAEGPTPRPRTTAPQPVSTPAPSTQRTPPPPPEPTPTPDRVALPGQDGPSTGHQLPVVAAGSQGGPLMNGRSLWAVVLTVILVLGVAGGGTAYVVIRIRRDARITS